MWKYFKITWIDLDTILLIAVPIFIFSLWRLRKGQLDLLHKKYLSISEVLLSDYPLPAYHDDLAKANELWIFGPNLKRIFQQNRKTYIEAALKNRGKVYALLVMPEPPEGQPAASTFTAMQDADVGISRKTIPTEVNLIRTNIAKLVELKETYPNLVEIKTINYPLTFGVDAIDPTTSRGVLYVRFYPYRADDRPILALRADDEFYDFYNSQRRRLWADGQPWIG